MQRLRGSHFIYRHPISPVCTCFSTESWLTAKSDFRFRNFRFENSFFRNEDSDWFRTFFFAFQIVQLKILISWKGDSPRGQFSKIKRKFSKFKSRNKVQNSTILFFLKRTDFRKKSGFLITMSISQKNRNEVWNSKILFSTKQVYFERTNKAETFWTSELNKKFLFFRISLPFLIWWALYGFFQIL